jgi:uncharacterized protein (DUF849 family)
MIDSYAPVILQVSMNGVGVSKGGRFPDTPERIAQVALECFELGASIVHNHVDRVKCSLDEAVARYIEGWRLIVAERPDALLFPTAHFDAPDGRPSLDHIEPLAESGLLKLTFCDVGSVCFITGFRDGLPRGAHIYGNSLDRVSGLLEQHGRLGIGTVVNVYDFAGLRHFLLLHRAGKSPRGCMVNLYLATNPHPGREPGFVGLPASEAAIDLCIAMLEGTGLRWSVTLFGGDLVQSGLATYALHKGGNLTVGLEAYGGEREPTNEQLVREAVALCHDAGRRTATPGEAAILLDLPAQQNTGAG